MVYLGHVQGDKAEAARVMDGAENHEAAYHGIMALVEKAEAKLNSDYDAWFENKYYRIAK
jgi:hypothetical protein